jgi:hypothetical protein
MTPQYTMPPGDRRQLAGRHRDHRLVQQREALHDPASLDEEVALHVHREREQIRVAEALADGRRAGGGRRGRVELAHGVVPERERHQQVPLLDALLAMVLHQALRAPEPAGRAPHLSAVQHQVHADPERDPGCTQRRAGVEPALVSPLEDVQALVVAPERVGRRREPLEVVRLERRGAIGAREDLVSVQPRASLDLLDGRHGPNPHVVTHPRAARSARPRGRS